MTMPRFFQLPSQVCPLKYNLTLAPDLEQFTFRGEETVDVEVREATREVVVNGVELTVQAASMILSDGTTVPVERTVYEEAAETLTFYFERELPVGRGQLKVEFTGELNDRLHGFYRSSYKTPDGTEQVLAATQFESTDARRAFPCWDEPALKATFEAALVIPSHLTAVSNAPIVSETTGGPGTKRVQFGETPAMSTYLLAFIVGELESIEGMSDGGTVIRVWTTPGKSNLGRFALEVATRLLAYYNDYFGIPYPLEKLDHLAIPDFAAGAMENWGAITYRETALLFDPQQSAPQARQRVAEVVAHEMAHMWFGDLVTMEWWNDLWLNESFASWMATKAINHLFPEWDIWSQFVVHDLDSGLRLDSLENSHPIEADVRDPSEISQLFDAISYSKGASIIRMLEQFIGPDLFQKGLYRYLSGHRYGNARTNNLWEAMEEESDQPVITVMNSWIRQTGFPVIKADVQRQGERVAVHLTQQRFLYSGANQDPTLWHVPISVSGQAASGTDVGLLTERHAILQVEKALPPSREGWVKLNSQQTGFYRVEYAEDEWRRLIPAVESQELPAADRLGLQGDAFAMARAGLIPATQFLSLARAYKNEQEYPVWADFGANLRQLDFLLSKEPYHAQFRAFARELLQPIAHQVGWDPKPGEGHLQVLLRSTVLGHLGAFGDPETTATAQSHFSQFLAEPSSLLPDLRGVVYGLAAQDGDGDTHNTLRRLAREATLQEEKLRLLASLARFQQPSILERTLKMSLSKEVRLQDTVMLVSAVAGNIHGGTELAWEYVKSNWAEFSRRYGSGGFAMMRLVDITGSFTTSKARIDVQKFFQANPTPSASRTIQQSLERIELNIRWLERNREELTRWFEG